MGIWGKWQTNEALKMHKTVVCTMRGVVGAPREMEKERFKNHHVFSLKLLIFKQSYILFGLYLTQGFSCMYMECSIFEETFSFIFFLSIFFFFFFAFYSHPPSLAWNGVYWCELEIRPFKRYSSRLFKPAIFHLRKHPYNWPFPLIFSFFLLPWSVRSRMGPHRNVIWTY